LRSLHDWHKYVDIQEKRVNSAKSGLPQDPSSDLSAVKSENSQPDHGHGNFGALDGSYADDPYMPDSCLADLDGTALDIVDEPLPEHLRPTPLPAMIEFAADDLSSRSEPDPGDYARDLDEPIAQATDSVSSWQVGEEPIQSDSKAAATCVQKATLEESRPARNGRSGNGAGHKETREELLARLLDPELTLEEAAQVLNVCPTTVRRYTNRGVLPHYRTIGNQRRFRLSQVLAFLELQETSRSQVLGNGQRGSRAEQSI
jgi:excisionase family DNA binding protein